MNMKIASNDMKKEQMIKEVLPIGNGAHIYAPREWIGEEVLIVRTIKPSLRERILQELEPYLENIIGIYLYGSYARGEAEENSDIDLLVIANKKIKISKKDFDIIVLEKNSFSKALELSPILLFSALAEAKTIVNPELLERLREKYKPKKEDFIDYVKETKNIININRELLEPYSLVLRLRGVYIINCLLDRSRYSHEKFKLRLKKNLPFVDIGSVYEAYAKIKNPNHSRAVGIFKPQIVTDAAAELRGFKPNLSIKKNFKSGNLNQKDLRLILTFLEKQTLALESRIHGKKRKEA